MPSRTTYGAKARYYEQYSTQELLAAGHLEEVGVKQYPRKTAKLSFRIEKALLTQLKQAAKQKRLSLSTLVRMWLIERVQENQAA
jgi:predicted HicB family RNase H-like nuclease